MPARAGARGARHRGARGLPLDRRAVARPARRSCRVPPRPCRSCSCSPTGRRPSRAATSASSGYPGSAELALDRMEPDDVAQLVRSKMEQLVGDGRRRRATPLVDLVAARSEGNPFYVEELLNYIVAQGDRRRRPGADRDVVRLPESLHTLVLSRIDAAAEGPRRTMKVASVVGRVFEAPTLPGAYEELGEPRRGPGRSRRPPDAGPRRPRPRGRPGVDVQARGDAGGRLREPPVRAACRAPRARRRLHRAHRRRRPGPRRAAAGAPLLAQRP